eukprot:7382298-Prymnesium_polylepis.1
MKRAQPPSEASSASRSQTSGWMATVKPSDESLRPRGVPVEESPTRVASPASSKRRRPSAPKRRWPSGPLRAWTNGAK